MYFEQAKWGQCIELCEEAVEKGREQRVDYKIIAKWVIRYSAPRLYISSVIDRALARVGNAYLKQMDYENAVKYFNKSLTEHRNPEVVTKKNEVSFNCVLC